ncbi:MAG: transporter substrate-binding protein, partial [Planctomycetaceae bacterium]
MLRKTLATLLFGLSTTLLLGGCGTDSSPESTDVAPASNGGSAAETITRVTDDPIEAAYFGVYVWKAAVEKAQSFEIDKVREAVYGLKFNAPGGKKEMHADNQHTLKPVYIGEILKDGQFKIVKAIDDGKLVSPDSYSSYLHEKGKAPAPTGGPQEGKEYPAADVTEETVKIGILHSLSGTMAISETSLKDVVLYAVDEINSTGGVLGRKIEPVIEDGASDWPLFAEKARKMIT